MVCPMVRAAPQHPQARHVEIVIPLPGQRADVEILVGAVELDAAGFQHRDFAPRDVTEVPGDGETGGSSADDADIGVEPEVLGGLGQIDDHALAAPPVDVGMAGLRERRLGPRQAQSANGHDPPRGEVARRRRPHAVQDGLERLAGPEAIEPVTNLALGRTGPGQARADPGELRQPRVGGAPPRPCLRSSAASGRIDSTDSAFRRFMFRLRCSLQRSNGFRNRSRLYCKAQALSRVGIPSVRQSLA